MTSKTLITTLSSLLAAAFVFSARADITTGLKGYWTFDEGSGSLAADASGNGNNGTLTNFADTGFTTMWTNGIVTNAIVFNQNGETTNYVVVPNSTSINAGQAAKEWTLSAWVKPSVAGGSQVGNAGIIAKGKLNLEEYALYLSGGKFQTRLRNSAGSGTMTATGTTTPGANQWYHVIAIVKEPRQAFLNSEALIYVNGTKESSTDSNTYTTDYASTEPLVIGAREDANGNVNLPFKGVIDEVRVYARALTNDVWQLYTNNVTSLSLTSQPRSVTCYSNDTVVFSAGVDSKTILPLTYQWWLTTATSTNLMSSVTNSSLSSTFTLPNVTNGNAGTYSVVISNAAGVVTTSFPATLTVQALPAANTSSGLVGWWKMDDGSGSSTAADSSGNGSTGTLVNFTDTSFQSQWGVGLIGGALFFNGDGASSNLVAVPSLGTSAPAMLDFNASPVFTLSAWVQAAPTQTNEAAIIAKGTGAGGEQYVLELNGNNYRFFVRDTNFVSYGISSTTAANGFWQHVAGVVNATNGTMSLYVNGLLVGSSVAPSSLLATNHEVSIGNRQSGTAGYNFPFTGAIDDVRIYSRDLTAADVYALYGASAYPIITTQLPATGSTPFSLFAGASPTFKVAVVGAAPFAYQWYINGAPDPAGTNASYQFTNLPVGAVTAYCIITNNLGSATSSTWSATVVAAPTASYPQVVLKDTPTGYWRLNETPDNGAGNNGTVANDYLGGNCGSYANTALGQNGYSVGLAGQYSYSPATDPYETSAQFGYVNAGVSNLVASIQGVDFSKPANQTANFSIEAWVKGDVTQYYSSGIVAKGAWGAEQFTLDTGGTSYSYRFTMRDASKKAYYITSNTNYPDGNWHHLVGVLDEANSNAFLYVDGVKVASLASSPSAGVISTTVPMSIGSRLGNGSVGYNQQFFGNINDVAVYNYALTATQVVTHYLAVGIPPAITQNPMSYTSVNEGTTLIVAAQGGGGTAPTTVQWYDVTAGTPGTPLANQTSNTLVINNISAALNGHSLALRVSNAFGTVYSSSVYLIVYNGVPVVTVTPASVSVYPNQPVVFKATATGTEPFSYQWSVNSTVVPGATSPTYSASAASGSALVTCTVTGPHGPGAASGTLNVQAAPADTYGSGILADHPLAYWRLDESTGATFANDYAGGHNAYYYSAVNGLPGFNPADPDTAAGFGMNGVANNSMALEQDNSAAGIPNLDFSKLGSNAQFSVEAWLKAPTGQPNGAGIICKGYGGGGEQFNLDLYGSAVRFFMRDAATNTHGPTSTFHVDGAWHHVVGVCDMSNGVVNLYVDGALQAFTTNLPGLGVLSALPAGTPVLTSIGSRMSSATDTSYTLQLTNAVVDEVALYGYALSSNQVAAHFTAAALPPQLVQDLQSQMYVYEGFPLTLTVLASSSTPMSYQWKRNGTTLSDGPGISGSQTNTLTLSVGQFSAGSSFQVFITNQGTSTPAVSTLATITVLPRLGFNGFGTQWSSQGNAKYTGANVLRLTDGGASEAASSYFGFPVYVGGFQATFTYQAAGNRAADGTAFVLQNDARGAAALGGAGGPIGYGGVTNSVAVEFNLYTSRGVGYAFATNGGTGSYTSASPVNIASGDPIDVTVLYANGVLSLTLTDAVAQTSFTATTNLNIPAVLGADTAYVGFTGGSGSVTAIQTVTNFTFVSMPALSIQTSADNHVLLSWPTAAGGGFALQQSASLGSGWTPVGTSPTVVGNAYQVTLPASASTAFYRLINGP